MMEIYNEVRALSRKFAQAESICSMSHVTREHIQAPRCFLGMYLKEVSLTGNFALVNIRVLIPVDEWDCACAGRE